MKKFSFEKITERRKQLGWSKTELAKRAGFTPQQIWDFENADGDKTLNVASLIKISEALGVTTDSFFVEQK